VDRKARLEAALSAKRQRAEISLDFAPVIPTDSELPIAPASRVTAKKSVTAVDFRARLSS
jgi:hypothetical protein